MFPSGVDARRRRAARPRARRRPAVSFVSRRRAGWAVEPGGSAVRARRQREARRAVTFQVRPPTGGKNVPRGARQAGRAALRRRRRGRRARSRAAWCASSTPTSRSRPCCADAEVRLVPARARDRRARASATSPARATRCRPACARVGYDVDAARRRRAGAGAAALARFDAIVVGVRAFNTSARLRAAHAALMAYVEARRHAGRPVQHQQPHRAARPRPSGPAPFDIGRDRVTDETRGGRRPIEPDAPAASRTPNRIGAARLRGLGAGARPLLRRQVGPALRDRARDARSRRAAAAGRPARGARHGKGAFVYTGLAFFRQLPAGVPGAYRLFANLLAGDGERGREPPEPRARRAGRRAAVLGTWRDDLRARARRARRRASRSAWR